MGARSHLRADRWYKVARTILYGSLEDEVRFTSVRRLVEHEDYILLKLQDAGLPSPRSLGFCEITPEREYAIVTEFLDNAKEMGDAEVDDDIIDQSLIIVRKLWDAGMAHRDIKPATVMVADGRVVLIDPAFATIRPSAWRQAVDLANMMIILALRTTPDIVYERDHLDIEAFIAELNDTGRSPSRVRQAHQILSMILKAAVRSRRIGINPAEGISLPRANPRPMKFIDSDEVARLAKAIPDRYESWVYVASYGGLRWAELVGLKRKRVNLLRRCGSRGLRCGEEVSLRMPR